MPQRGSCYGFDIRSDLEFRFLREGGGEELHIGVHTEEAPRSGERLLVEWKPQPGRPFHGRVYADSGSDRLRIWTSDAGWFLVDPESRRIAVPTNGDAVVREARLWTTPMLLTFVNRGAMPLHAAAVELEGEAVLFGAPSGFGKTTLAAAFAARGHRLLAEDVTCIVSGNGKFSVLPGPSLLRLRPDVADALAVPGTHVVSRMPDRVFLTFDETLRGDSRPVPLRGIILLRGDHEKLILRGVSGPELLRDLWALAFRLPSDDDTERVFDGVTALADGSRVWDLHRPRDLAGVLDTVDQIAEALDGV